MELKSNEEKITRALLVSVDTGEYDAQASLDELFELVNHNENYNEEVTDKIEKIVNERNDSKKARSRQNGNILHLLRDRGQQSRDFRRGRRKKAAGKQDNNLRRRAPVGFKRRKGA